MKTKPQPSMPQRADGYVAVTTTAELPPGEHKIFQMGEHSLVLFHIAGEYSALENRCSHDDGPLGEGLVYDCEVMCPRHGARFDLRTGKVLSFPAVADVAAYPVKVEDDKILVQLNPPH